jgi:iron complex transport system substrate-binding protein
VYVADANTYFSRPGPRIVDSLEMLADALHPKAGVATAKRLVSARVQPHAHARL